MKFAVLLHGSGVYDGTEIHEAVLTLLALEERGHSYQCVAPDVMQHHTINHLTGEEMDSPRNVLVESARIARGKVIPLSQMNLNDYHGLLMPGGFGTAKNLTRWAFEGPKAPILPEVKDLILSFVQAGKPIGVLCMSPTTVALALEGSGISAELSVGSAHEASPYPIADIHGGMASTGATTKDKNVREIMADPASKIICAPCYMMEASLLEVRKNAEMCVEKVIEWAK